MLLLSRAVDEVWGQLARAAFNIFSVSLPGSGMEEAEPLAFSWDRFALGWLLTMIIGLLGGLLGVGLASLLIG